MAKERSFTGLDLTKKMIEKLTAKDPKKRMILDTYAKIKLKIGPAKSIYYLLLYYYF